MKLVAIQVFRDKITGYKYSIGDFLNITEKSRIKDLLKRKLVKEYDDKRLHKAEVSDLRDSTLGG